MSSGLNKYISNRYKSHKKCPYDHRIKIIGFRFTTIKITRNRNLEHRLNNPINGRSEANCPKRCSFYITHRKNTKNRIYESPRRDKQKISKHERLYNLINS